MESRHGTEAEALYEYQKPGQSMQAEIVCWSCSQWIVEDLKANCPTARILSSTYDSSAGKSEIARNMSPPLLGENLPNKMVSMAGEIGQNYCPVVFVYRCHGKRLKGLVAMRIEVRCLSNIEDAKLNEKFLSNMKTMKIVCQYRTPHGSVCVCRKNSSVENLNPTRTERDIIDAVNKDDKFYVVAPEGQSNVIRAFKMLAEEMVREPRLYENHVTVFKFQSKDDRKCLDKLTKWINSKVIGEYTRRTTVDLPVVPIGIERQIDEFSELEQIDELYELLERPEVSIVGLIGRRGVEEEKSSRGYSKLRAFFASECNTPSLVDDCLSQCSRDLRRLHLTNCLGVTQIGIQKLCSFGGLRMLHITDCDNIVELPEDIDKLINLVEMEVHGCSNLQSLPDTIGKLINLVEMKVLFCSNLQSLPGTIGRLKNLKRLVIEYCGRLEVVPDSVGELCEVEHLSFWGCDQLKVIHGTQIYTQKLMKLRLPIVPTTCLRSCPHLRHLYIGNGRGVKEFPLDFFEIHMPKLEVVYWWGLSFEGEVPSEGEVVLKNPDGSELVLKTEACLWMWTMKRLKVHRQHDGSISRFSLSDRYPWEWE